MALDSKPKTHRVPETRLVKCGSAAVAIWWTILLLLPVHLFSTNLSFLGLQHMGNSLYWAAGAALVAFLQLYGLYSQSLIFRWAGHITAAMFYAFITAGVYLGSHFWFHLPINTGFGVYGVCTVLNAYCAVFVLPTYVVAELAARREAKLHKAGNTSRTADHSLPAAPSLPADTSPASAETKSTKSIRNVPLP